MTHSIRCQLLERQGGLTSVRSHWEGGREREGKRERDSPKLIPTIICMSMQSISLHLMPLRLPPSFITPPLVHLGESALLATTRHVALSSHWCSSCRWINRFTILRSFFLCIFRFILFCSLLPPLSFPGRVKQSSAHRQAVSSSLWSPEGGVMSAWKQPDTQQVRQCLLKKYLACHSSCKTFKPR